MRNLIWGLLLFSASVFSQNPSFSFLLTDTLRAGDTLTVKVGINKTGISGFAKLEIYVPAGFTPCCHQAPGTSIIFSDNLLKYIWMDIPASEKITLVLKFITDPRLYGMKELYGSFHYIKGKERTKEKVPVTTVFLDNANKKDIPEHLLSIYNRNHKIPVPDIQTGPLTFRVQIGAFKKQVPAEILAEFYSDVSKIKEEYTGGYYKYTIGDFGALPQASDFRERCGIPGAFVVKYVKGVRQ